MSLLYWIRLLQETQMTFKLNLFQYVAIASVWGFDIAATMTEFQSKGFGGISDSTHLFVSASLIALISTTFLLYGLEILKRINAAEEMALPQHYLTEDGIPYQDSTAMMSASNRSVPVRKPAFRVYKVLILAESLSVVTITGQVSVGSSVGCYLRLIKLFDSFCRSTWAGPSKLSHGGSWSVRMVRVVKKSTRMFKGCTAFRYNASLFSFLGKAF